MQWKSPVWLPLRRQNVLGYKSITIPGAVAGLSLALQKFGRLGIDTILSKTIELADRGLPVDWYTTLQIALESKDLSKFKESSKIYLPGNFPPNPEQYIPLGNLLKTLKSDLAARDLNIVNTDDIYRLIFLANDRPQWRKLF